MHPSGKGIITLYDSILDPAAWPTNPHTWKIRYALNYVKAPYRTIWVPLSEVGTTRESLGLPAICANQNRNVFSSLPILHNPCVVDRGEKAIVLDNAFEIAMHIKYWYGWESAYSLFPGDAHESVGLHHVFNSVVDELFTQYGLPLAEFYLSLDPRTAESDKTVILRRFPENGKAKKWEDLEVPLGSELRNQVKRFCWQPLGTMIRDGPANHDKGTGSHTLKLTRSSG
ncbi:hypothetical protein PG985_008566 [Apiospora marii]|uniref:GST N-terminal domain-containing protein n=1 Tax=Apiospora marii TaxID=335849 RepID=A0ABR1R2T7_9PEZI